MQILGRETQDLKSLPAGCPVIQSRCFVAGGLLGDVYPAGGGKSSIIHTAHMMWCIKLRRKKKKNKRVVFSTQISMWRIVNQAVLAMQA